MKYKKIFSVLALGLACLGITSCADDNDSNPVLNTAPTTFVVNEPTMGEQHIQLTPDNTVSLSWSQPDYGFAAYATYSVEVGIVKDGTIKWAKDKLATTFNTCTATIPGEEIAEAMNDVEGFKSEDEYTDKGFREVAFRIHSAILDGEGNDIEVTKIASNVVTFKHMNAYKAVAAPRKMFVVGACSGWTTPDALNADAYKDWVIMETGVKTNIYQGTFDINAGEFQLRFYSALTGWDAGASIGAIEDDVTTAIELENGVFDGSVAYPTAGMEKGSKGSWQVTDWAGGKVRMTLDLNKATIKFEAVN